MWYFAWLLGLPLAAAFAVLNGMWFEITEDNDARRRLMSDIPGDNNPADSVA
ncbi:MAG: cytochrome bd-I oxidase subunit CydX [Dokdonella sp.]